MTKTKKWKDKLLSSGVPLEYEIAKLLVEHRFAVDSDYSYSRNDCGAIKEFSVDIHATAFPPYTGEVAAELSLLIECKQRHSNNKWLFFPDPNTEEFATFRPGDTLRAIDTFSFEFFRSRCTSALDETEGTVCLKGVEIDLSTGAVHDSEIKHGLAQLQYALPRLLTEFAIFNVPNYPEDNNPFFYCPILLTSSQIYVANAKTTISSIKDSEFLEDIASVEPFVLVHLDSSPDFDLHRAQACHRLLDLSTDPAFHQVEAFRKKARIPVYQLPSEICTRLAEPNGGKFLEYFSQAVVCTAEHLPGLIERIKYVANDAVRSKKRTRIKRPSARA